MSRSRYRTPILAHTAARNPGVMAWWKKSVAGALRGMFRQQLCHDPEDPFISHRLAGDIWASPCDGKCYHIDIDPRYLRK